MGTAAIRPFLPLQAEPAHVFDHGLGELHFRAGCVDVFVAQDQDAAGGQGAPLGDPKRLRVTEVEEAGGRRGEAAAVGRRKRLDLGVQISPFGFSFSHALKPGRGNDSRAWIFAELSEVSAERGGP